MSDGLAKARLKLAEIKASGQKVERLDPLEKSRREPGSLRSLTALQRQWHNAFTAPQYLPYRP